MKQTVLDKGFDFAGIISGISRTFWVVCKRTLKYKEVISMKYEKPSMVIVKQEPVKHAVGPDGCSTKYTGCCYRD